MFYRMMLILVGLGAPFILGSYSCQAQQAAVTITGQKQGILKGTPFLALPDATGAVLSFSYDVEVTTPIGTASSGAGAGKVQHNPIVFSRRSDGASPEIYLALTTGDPLTVKFEFLGSGPKPGDKPSYMITLTNARVVKFSQQIGATPEGLTDTISLSFDKIEETFLTGNKTVTATVGNWNRISNSTNLLSGAGAM